MMKFVVIDDEESTQRDIKMIIRDAITENDKDIEIEMFKKYNSKLEEIINNTTERKIYILDVDLGDSISGIQIAKKIREVDWESEIIFLTNHDKMFEIVYRNVYVVFDFIEKFHEMPTRLKKAIKLIMNKQYDNKMFRYHSRNIDIQIFYKSITHIYRDKEERKVVICTDKNKYSLCLSIVEVMKSLDSRFALVHRACIVNMDRVERFDWANGCFVLDSGEVVNLLSKKYKKEVMKYAND